MPSVRVKEVFPSVGLADPAHGKALEVETTPATAPATGRIRLALAQTHHTSGPLRHATTSFGTPSRLHNDSPVHSGEAPANGMEVNNVVPRVDSIREEETAINLSHGVEGSNDVDHRDYHHHDDVVEHLDVIDAQVGAFTTLTNAANSIVIPLSSLYSRKPIVAVPQHTGDVEKGEILKDSLDRHVDDVLKRRSKIRRTLLGVWSFLKTPIGILTGVYGLLVVFWSTASLMLLTRIINFHDLNVQGFWIEISSQVKTGLFTLTSIGFAPFRILDTYRIWKIWLYKRRIKVLRAKAGLPQLFDEDDLPDQFYDPNYVHVLNDEDEKDLHRQQWKFQHSQTWYRAHGTETHRAFPINMALLICFLNDGNSICQAFLCWTMWGMNRFERPIWTAAILVPGTMLCGIGAALLIWRVGERTKRVEEVMEKLRDALENKDTREYSFIVAK